MPTKAAVKNSIVCPRPISPYDEILLTMVQSHGGFYNAHAHYDRADTLPAEYLNHIHLNPFRAASSSLKVKQHLTGDLHNGLAYTEEDLRARMGRVIERQIACGITLANTCIDATPDIGENGQLAFRIALELKDKYADRIIIRLGPMPIFGFKEAKRWDVFAEAAAKADFIAGLPEKDDFSKPHERDGRVGFKKHIRMVMELGCQLKKEVHLHLDQANNPNECGTETLLEGLDDWLDQPQIPDHEGPTVWVIHMISPSAYEEMRFRRMAEKLLRLNVGVIACPSAAISMRQLRSVSSATHASIARVLELCKMRIPVLIGTDNICDIYVPQCSGDMLAEAIFGGHGIRFAYPHVWAKLVSGIPLNDVDRDAIGETLYQDMKVLTDIDPAWIPAVD